MPCCYSNTNHCWILARWQKKTRGARLSWEKSEPEGFVSSSYDFILYIQDCRSVWWGRSYWGLLKKKQNLIFTIFILLSFHFDVDAKWYMLRSLWGGVRHCERTINSSGWGISSRVGNRQLSLRGLVPLVPLDTMTWLGSWFFKKFLHEKISFHYFFLFGLKVGAADLHNFCLFIYTLLLFGKETVSQSQLSYIFHFHFLKRKVEDFMANSPCLLFITIIL